MVRPNKIFCNKRDIPYNNAIKTSSVFMSSDKIENLESFQYFMKNLIVVPLRNCVRRNFNVAAVAKKLVFLSVPIILLYKIKVKRCWASVAAGILVESRMSPVQELLVWAACFAISAVLHCSESAITKISPFKVHNFNPSENIAYLFHKYHGRCNSLLKKRGRTLLSPHCPLT